MAAGLFELRKDAITGWWVATVVDREFHRDRFARAAEPVADVDCQNCRLPDGPGVRTRTLKDFAFHTVGTDDEARELDRGVAQVAIATARASGSWRTVVAPPGPPCLGGRRQRRVRPVRLALAVRAVDRAATPRCGFRPGRGARRRRHRRGPAAGPGDPRGGARRTALQPRPPHRTTPRAG